MARGRRTALAAVNAAIGKVPKSQAGRGWHQQTMRLQRGRGGLFPKDWIGAVPRSVTGKRTVGSKVRSVVKTMWMAGKAPAQSWQRKLLGIKARRGGLM